MTKDINVIQKQFIVSMNGRIWSVNIIKIPDIYIYYKRISQTGCFNSSEISIYH